MQVIRFPVQTILINIAQSAVSGLNINGGFMKILSALILALALTLPANAAYIQAPYTAAAGGTGGDSSAATGVAKVAAGVWSYAGILNADVQAGAAIAFSKLASLTSAHLLVGSAGNVATDVAVSGDLTLANTGEFSLVNASVTGQALTGYVSGAGTVAATDSILQAIQKINGNQVSSGTMTVANGGDAAYTILSGTGLVRAGTTLTANRTYTLPACAANIGEKHFVKNPPAQTFNIVLAAAGADKIDGAASVNVLPGDDFEVACGAAGVWDQL
jgi:hypothetical protein